LLFLYSEHPWKILLFKLPENFWENKENHRYFTDWLFKELQFKQMDDWYQINKEDISEKNGNMVLFKYGGSRFKMLQSIYPQHSWIRERFVTSTLNNWNTTRERYFMDNLGKELGFTKMNDWYKIRKKDIQEKGGLTLFIKYGELHKLLSSVYPEHKWKVSRFKMAKYVW
jgi:hypothetical protein